MSEFKPGVLWSLMQNIYAIEDHFKKSIPEPVNGGSNFAKYPPYDVGPRGNGPNLRFDAEAGSGDKPDFDFAFKCMISDILDLLECGDVNNLTDALLHASDGIRKHGQWPVSVKINKASLYIEWNKTRNQWEVIMYTVLDTQWPEQC